MVFDLQIIGQENKTDRPRKYEELAYGVYSGWGGALDRNAVKIMMKRTVGPVDDNKTLWKLNRDIRVQNNQILGANTFSFINEYHVKPTFPRKGKVYYV